MSDSPLRDSKETRQQVEVIDGLRARVVQAEKQRQDALEELSREREGRLRKTLLKILLFAVIAAAVVGCSVWVITSCSAREGARTKFNDKAKDVTFQGAESFQKKYGLKGTAFCSWNYGNDSRIRGEPTCTIHHQIKPSIELICSIRIPFCRCEDTYCRQTALLHLTLKEDKEEP